MLCTTLGMSDQRVQSLSNNKNGYIKEINGNKYLIIILINENRDKLKKYEKL